MTADAMRRHRLRRAGLLPDLATCTACGRQARSTRTAPLCSRCWRRSPAGREWNRLRMAAQRLTTVAAVPTGTPIKPSIMRAFITAALLLLSPAQARQVTATVYDGWYHGRTTYCGGTYQHWGISAAHPWLPCGTRVTVRHGSRTLTVPVTDRCDCNSLDLSAGAAHQLGVPLDGIATVSIRY